MKTEGRSDLNLVKKRILYLANSFENHSLMKITKFKKNLRKCVTNCKQNEFKSSHVEYWFFAKFFFNVIFNV